MLLIIELAEKFEVRANELATLFHQKAWPLLSSLDFELQNDPAKSVGRPGFAVTTADYRSRQGLYLRAGFDPFDGASAVLACGRRWHYASNSPREPEYDRLSNSYDVLAKEFGFDLPSYYPLRPGDEAITAIENMVADLKATLATIAQRVTQDILIAVEGKKFGCQWLDDEYGQEAGTSRLESISPYPEELPPNR